MPAVASRVRAGHVAGLCAAAVLAVSAVRAEDGKQARGTNKTATTVVVFAAASLKTALDAAGKAWAAESGKRVAFSYAASGALAKQIENGAPADLYASADQRWMDYAAANKLIKPESRTDLLGNRLVLVAPRGTAASLAIAKGFKLAEAAGDSRIVMGAPGTVPAGTYAREALASLGVWDAVAGKIAGTENVRAALALVARGEAAFGIVYATDAKSEPKVAVVGTFPADSHQPIIYPFALTAGSSNAAAAEFLAYLRRPAARKIFEGEGFSVFP